MNISSEATNKALVLVALDTLFNQREYCTAEQYWSPSLILHCAYMAPGRDGLFEFVRAAPVTLRFEPGAIVANDDLVIVHARIPGNGRPRNWIVATILRIEDGRIAEQWQVIQDEASQADTRSGHPLFGDKFSDEA
jgi:predicted SnoaL-like aldol condensation-catalyzing enzyme